jgi:hypothetical protein
MAGKERDPEVLRAEAQALLKRAKNRPSDSNGTIFYAKEINPVFLKVVIPPC